MHAPSTILVDYGDLPSLALLALHLETPRLILFQVIRDDSAGAARQRVIKRHAELADGADVLVCPAPISIESSQPLASELDELHVILQASYAALQMTCSRVVSPHVVGRDHQAVAVAFERAVGLQQLIERDGRHRAPLLELPLIDCSDAQILELVVDHRVPLTECWPCDRGGATPCSKCRSCRRWQDAFEQAGVPWPWPSSRSAEVPGRPATLMGTAANAAREPIARVG